MSSDDFGLVRVAVVDLNSQATTVDQTAKQQFVGQAPCGWCLESSAASDAHPSSGSKPFLGQVLAQLVGEGDLDFLLGQLGFKLQQEFVNHSQDDVFVQAP
jgi:hypothetical protein